MFWLSATAFGGSVLCCENGSSFVRTKVEKIADFGYRHAAIVSSSTSRLDRIKKCTDNMGTLAIDYDYDSAVTVLPVPCFPEGMAGC